MVREQRITLYIGTESDDPDADVALRTALNVLKLLEAVDRRKTNVGHPRYRWKLTDADKSSPFKVECTAVFRGAQWDTHTDVVGDTVRRLKGVGEGDKKSIAGMDAKEVEYITHIGSGHRRVLPVLIEIPGEDGTATERFRVTDTVRRNAETFRQEMTNAPLPPTTEYVTLEGRLVKIEMRKNKNKYILGLEDRDTGREIICHFNPLITQQPGAHMEHRILVEGELSTSEDGSQRLDVMAYKIIPKDPISIDEIHALNLRTPNGMSTDDYVRSLRGEDE